ncbi:DUF4880 domain-containing protein [Pseudoalteromonas sp. YIC-656]|uniref:DUF4880 domain-containing protein n=1 Tax=Pseudoalteromonas pernae TaxID=3118054 RepID=UPI003242B12C
MAFDEWSCFGIEQATIKQASHWISVLDSEQCSDAQKREFLIWLDELPENRWAFEELAEGWAKLNTLTDVLDKLETSEVVPFPESEKHSNNTTDHENPHNSLIAPYIGIGLIVLGFVLAII